MDIPDIHLASVGTALPGPPIDNTALAHVFGVDTAWVQWVDTFIDTRTRYIAMDLDTGEQLRTLTDLAETACRRALESAGIDAGEVDLMVMGTAMPDLLMPTTVNLVAERLGINEVTTYQLQSGCSGAFQALDVARQLMLTGRHGTALVVGGDVCAKHVDFRVDFSTLEPAQLVNLALFGDGAGAAVLTREPTHDAAVIRHVFTRLVGLDRAPGHLLDWFGPGDKDSDRPGAAEDYKAIEEFVPPMSVEILHEVLDRVGWRKTDLDYLLPPQLSGRMTRHITQLLNVPQAHEVSCVRETGNTGNATPFLQLEQVLPKMAPGDRALGISVESSKWIKAGFALEKI